MLDQLRNANFGRSNADATGSSGVGYTLFDVSGSIVSPRTTVGVYQLESGSGLYAAYVSFPDRFRGQIMWDTGALFPTKSYAVEQFNVEENDPVTYPTYSAVLQMSSSVETIRQFSEGRWRIVGDQMLFYDKDNTTLVATFNLYDDTGSPTMDAVFERVRQP